MFQEDYFYFECNFVADELKRCERLKAAGKFSKTIDECTDLEALAVLVEEVGEAGHEVNEAIGRAVDHDRQARLHTELIQVAAMALAWAGRLRREQPPVPWNPLGTDPGPV